MKASRIIICALCTLCALPLSAKQKKVAIVAHRGYWNCEQGGQSHNSIASLTATQDLGFWGSEFDVNMTRDGELMVYHDDKVGGMAFIDHNAADFADIRLKNGEAIPTLDQYLDRFGKNKNCRLVFELKPHRTPELEKKAVELCLEKLKNHGLYNPKQVIFISFSFYQCCLFAENCPGFTVQYLGSDEAHNPNVCAEHGINGVDTNYYTLLNNPTWYKDARSNAQSVNAWTANDEKTMRALIELGVDYITTDYPEMCRALLKEMKIKELKAGKNF